MPRGVRLNPEHDERTRAKIQTSQIINRLQSFINGEVELNPAQVTASLGLLKKTLPDLTAVEHSGEIATRHEDALDDLDDRPRAGNPAAVAGQSGELRAEVSKDQDQGRVH